MVVEAAKSPASGGRNSGEFRYMESGSRRDFHLVPHLLRGFPNPGLFLTRFEFKPRILKHGTVERG